MSDIIPVEEFFKTSSQPIAQPINQPTTTPIEQPKSQTIPVEQFFAKPAEQQPKSGLIEQLGKRKEQVQNIIESTGVENFGAGTVEQQGLPEAALQVAGKAAATVGDVIGSGVSKILEAPFPQLGGYSISQVAKGLGIVAPQEVKEDAIAASQFAQQVASEYNKNEEQFNKGNPRAGRNLEAIRELAFVVPSVGTQTGREAIAKGVTALGGGAKQLSSKTGEVIRGTETSGLFKPLESVGIDIDSSAIGKLQASLQKEAKVQQDRISNLYAQAEERGRNATIPQQKLLDFADSIEKNARLAVDSDAKSLWNTAAQTIRENATADDIVNTVNDLQTLRRNASKASQKTFAGGELAQLLDEFLEQPNLIQGDTGAVKAWSDAISARREFGQKFEKPAKIAKAVGDGTPETIEQVFIGSAGALDKELANTYKSVVKALPADEKRLGAFQLRQAIVNKWIKNAARATDEPDSISAARMANQIKTFRTENTSMWRAFPEAERKTLTNLEKKLQNVSKRGVLDLVGSAITAMARKSRVASNLEMPRTMKPKTIISIDELLNMARTPKKGGANAKQEAK